MTHTTVIQRSRIHYLRKKGYSFRKIALEENLSHSTVAYICKYNSTETCEYKPSPGIFLIIIFLRFYYIIEIYLNLFLNIGPKSTVSEHLQRKITRLILTGKCQTAVDVKASLQVNDQVEVSADIIRRILKNKGLVARIKKKTPFLSKRHCQLRLEFALKYKNWTKQAWKKVVWSDESKFDIFNTARRQYYWKLPGTPLQDSHVKATVKYPGSIMIWGCFTEKGLGFLSRIDNILDGELYRKILDDEFMMTLDYFHLSTKNIIFQQDNDPKHTANLTKQWFVDNNVRVLSWPPQSPDLNPIEHLWDEIDRRLRKLYDHPTSKDDLWRIIQDVWNDLHEDTNVYIKLIESMPERIQDVIKAKGGYTRW
jgi:hypothetical protein